MDDAEAARGELGAENLQRIPSARTIARLMTNGRNTLSKADTVTFR